MYFGKIQPMDNAVESLPNDLEQLKALVLQQQERLADLESQLSTVLAKSQHQSDTINQLIEAMKLARHQHFGTRSEKFQSDSAVEQLAFLFNEPEALADLDAKAVAVNYPIIYPVLKSFMNWMNQNANVISVIVSLRPLGLRPVSSLN